MGVLPMGFFTQRGWPALPRAWSRLTRTGGVARCCGLLAVLLASQLLVPFPSELSVNTAGWTLTDFAEYLRQRGVSLHVVPGDRCGDPIILGYLTEDPDATWAAMQSKVRNVTRIHQWRGPVPV